MLCSLFVSFEGHIKGRGLQLYNIKEVPVMDWVKELS